MEKIDVIVSKAQGLDKVKEIKKWLIEKHIIHSDSDLHLGFVTDIFVKDIKTRDGNAFQQIVLSLIDSDGKRYEKKYSVDFARKYFAQLGYKAIDLFNSVVAFRVKDKYKNIGYFAFVVEGDDAEGAFYGFMPYKDEESLEMLERLKKLGI